MDTKLWDESELIQYIRWESNLTQTEFGIRVAELVRRDRLYSRTTVARWESGLEVPNLTLPLLHALAILGSTSIEELCLKLGYGKLLKKRIS